jgi:hypothetical protein
MNGCVNVIFIGCFRIIYMLQNKPAHAYGQIYFRPLPVLNKTVLSSG